MIYYILISATYDLAYLNDWAGVNEKYISYVLAGENKTEEFRATLAPEIEAAAEEYRKSLKKEKTDF
jgi:hypothetical protein